MNSIVTTKTLNVSTQGTFHVIQYGKIINEIHKFKASYRRGECNFQWQDVFDMRHFYENTIDLYDT